MESIHTFDLIKKTISSNLIQDVTNETMRNFLLLILSASQILLSAPAPAKNMTKWVDTDCYQGQCTSVKIISPIFFKHRAPDGQIWKVEADCKKGRTRAIYNDGTKARWFEVPANSVGESMLLQVCR